MCICKRVFVCVRVLELPGRPWTISGSVPHPLQCLIGETDQSERGLVVPTIKALCCLGASVERSA